MIRTVLLLISFTACSLTMQAQHPFKYDNTIYKAVYLNEAFRLMDSMQNYLLLDVRSPCEYADTSRSTALNIGRFKGAVNITIDSVPAQLTQLKKYIDHPVFLICSHSQRSRRVSKLLAENGFKKVYNINGGMSLVNELDNNRFVYKNKVLVTNTAYKNIASTDAISLITNTPGLIIIDIRTPQEFASHDTVQQNNVGRFKNAINIPQDVFQIKLDSLKLPISKPVLLYDLNGYNSMDVVEISRAKGFTNIYNLFEGFAAFICDHALNKKLRDQLLTGMPAYQLVDPKAGIDLLKQDRNLVILDTRPQDQFDNKAKMGHMNVGRIKGAIHITSLDSLNSIVAQKDKSTQFMVYGSGGDLSTMVCEALITKRFKHVNFLSHGLYRFVWATANIEECKTGREFLTNHDGLY